MIERENAICLSLDVARPYFAMLGHARAFILLLIFYFIDVILIL
jgi:hypothetical protein